MKFESGTSIERAVRQACQEADILYNLAMDVNFEVITSTSGRVREAAFLVQYFRCITNANVGPHSEEEIRRTVLYFVRESLLACRVTGLRRALW